MTNRFTKTIILSLLAVVLFSCNKKVENTVKFHPNDPFKNTMTPSQYFDIDASLDNVVEGENGTIIICPKGCFRNSKGDVVEGNVKIELAEALTAKDMLLSNLTATSDGKLLETDGMIYFNATASGEQLTINKSNPVHIEIPTEQKKAGMKVYQGVRDEKGNMNWVKPKEVDHFLNTVDIFSLDFLPEGFQAEVDKGMPYKNHKIATQGFTDSLYYHLSDDDFMFEIFADLFQITIKNSNIEPYYKQPENSDREKPVAKDTACSPRKCGIDPAKIKVIKSEKYQNTLIATKEFEARLRVIFRTCDDEVLEIYINNLDKNLFELDSMAAMKVRGSDTYDAFINFANQRLTKVKQADKYSKLLKGYYEKQLAKVKSELEQEQQKVINELKKKDEEAQKVVDKYKKLLWKREKYRMETYGFNWTETGWINIDNGTLPKEWSSEPLEITLTNGKQFDRAYTYVIYTSIKSLYRLNTSDNEHFFAGNEQEKEMLMPKKKVGVAIAIGYKGEMPSLAVKEFETGSEPKFSLILAPSTLDKIKEAVKPYEKYEKENKIGQDLEFMAKFHKEEQRKKQLGKEGVFLRRLWNIAYPCCAL